MSLSWWHVAWLASSLVKLSLSLRPLYSGVLAPLPQSLCFIFALPTPEISAPQGLPLIFSSHLTLSLEVSFLPPAPTPSLHANDSNSLHPPPLLPQLQAQECLHPSDAWALRLEGGGFPGGSVIKNLPAMQYTRVQSLGWEDPPEKEMATYSSILAWRIP